MELKDKKIAILVENFYEDMDLGVPYYRLKEEGIDGNLITSRTPKDLPAFCHALVSALKK